MFEIKGKHNTIQVYAKAGEPAMISQLMEIANLECYSGNRIRIMPDCHAGAGAVVGTTMTLERDCISPSYVGVDIACSVVAARLDIPAGKIDLDTLDKAIRKHIPSGFDVRESVYAAKRRELEETVHSLLCVKHINVERALLSAGSLGGGNHFMAIEADTSGHPYFVVHTGSRYLGKQIAEYYQERAVKERTDDSDIRKAIVANLKTEGRQAEIPDALKALKRPGCKPEHMWLEGQSFFDYLHDMKLAQQYSSLNRRIIADVVSSAMGIGITDYLETMHNYIDTDARILRKGAVAANKGQRLIIPINMRDGSLLCTGKGNPDWNYSTCHGAGRVMSRHQAREQLSMDDYQKTMEGIYTTCVSRATLDEAPDAYKPIDEIMEQIGETVDIVENIKPIYNFKAGD